MVYISFPIAKTFIVIDLIATQTFYEYDLITI